MIFLISKAFSEVPVGDSIYVRRIWSMCAFNRTRCAFGQLCKPNPDPNLTLTLKLTLT